ncbi:MAG: lactate racemase domain-containing protein [Isosphaeraceae bacterium]|nr:lactate racemase domain-containing protein [Isosphaeraceae bacterium]
MSPTLPPIARVRQSFNQPEVRDVPAAVARAISQSRIKHRVRPGGSIALTVGSRGIAGIDRIVKAAVEALRGLGFHPFVVAAMGSHGGGTAEGQGALLAELGVTEETVGCPVRTEMETVVLGTNSFGLPIHFDKNAFQADGILLLNRIKPHTSFTGRYESGLLKMLAIGLGKREGAAQVHKLGLPGLKTLLPEVGAFLLQKTPVALGVALLENAREHTARVAAIEPDDLLEVEPRLLDEARVLMARLPFDQIDVLIVGELGKNYSGTGLDPNVIGRQRVETMPDLPRPVVTRLGVLDLSVETCGNGLGVGLADLTTDRLVSGLDPTPMRVNSLTSNFLTRARVPLSLPTDRALIAACLNTCWRIDWAEARMVMIPNTLELTTLWVTPALQRDVESLEHLSRETDYGPIPFRDETLDQEALFPDSVRARRRGFTTEHTETTKWKTEEEREERF